MRYFVAFLIAVGLIFLLVLLMFGGGKPKTAVAGKALYSYATTDAQVQMTIDGPVNSALEHEQVQVTVDSNNVTFEQLQGYDGNVTNIQTYANTQNAYAVFLRSLEYAGFTKGDNSSQLRDERGYCPTGSRYIFTLSQDGNNIERYWSTTCGNPKTYLGSLDLTTSLFKAQVPDYDKLTEGIAL